MLINLQILQGLQMILQRLHFHRHQQHIRIGLLFLGQDIRRQRQFLHAFLVRMEDDLERWLFVGRVKGTDTPSPFVVGVVGGDDVKRSCGDGVVWLIEVRVGAREVAVA